MSNRPLVVGTRATAVGDWYAESSEPTGLYRRHSSRRDRDLLMRCLVVILLSLITSWSRADDAPAKMQPGVAHIGGRYSFSEEDY